MALLAPDKTYDANGVKVNQYFLTDHNPNKITLPSKRVKKLIGITVHNTEAIKVNNTTMAEQYTRATVNGNMNTVRVHYYVDNVEAWQNLPDDNQSWHSTDGNGDGNTATISIECIMAAKGYEKSEDNCAKLVAYLLNKYGLTTKDVYTHTYWLNVRDGRYPEMSKDEKCVANHPYKVCPAYIIPHWGEFLKKIEAYMPKNEKKTKLYGVQVGAYADRKNAENKLKEVKINYPEAFIKEFDKYL